MAEGWQGARAAPVGARTDGLAPAWIAGGPRASLPAFGPLSHHCWHAALRPTLQARRAGA